MSGAERSLGGEEENTTEVVVGGKERFDAGEPFQVMGNFGERGSSPIHSAKIRKNAAFRGVGAV